MTPWEALDRIAALCDALDREVAYEEDGLFAGITYSTAKVRAVLAEVSPEPGDMAEAEAELLHEILDGPEHPDQTVAIVDRADGRELPGVVLTPEEADLVRRLVTRDPRTPWSTRDNARLPALAARLEAAS